MSLEKLKPLHQDGRHYDSRYGYLTRDIAFWHRIAKRYGAPVLELACGTGRITIPFAKEGSDIFGLDISYSMLQQARRKATRNGVEIGWIQADYRDFHLSKLFSLIIISFNGLAHLYDFQDIVSFSSSVRRHLTEQGRFVIDFFNPRLELLIRDPGKRFPAGSYPHPDGTGEVVVAESNLYDARTQINTLTWYYRIGEEEFREELKMRIFFPQELEALLHYNDFVVEAKFGNYDESPFTSTSPRQILVCRKK